MSNPRQTPEEEAKWQAAYDNDKPIAKKECEHKWIEIALFSSVVTICEHCDRYK